MIALVDSDFIPYRYCHACSGHDLEHIIREVDIHIRWIMHRTEADDIRLFLTGEKSWRKDKYPDYKGNRVQPKPEWFYEVQQHLVEEWNAEFAPDGYEADDIVAEYAKFYFGIWRWDMFCVVAQDKDLNTVPGTHFNPVKDIIYWIYPEYANLWLYCQMIIGDTADNIKGLPQHGPMKAYRILSQGNPRIRTEAAYRYALGSGWEAEYKKNLELLSLGL